MAEQMAELNKSEGIQFFEFDVTNVATSGAWGSVYSSGEQFFDTGINLTNKKFFVWFKPTTEYSAWLMSGAVRDNTKVVVVFMRPNNATINGKLYVMVTN